jgi:hypothetical protein
MTESTTTKDVLDFPGAAPKPSSGLNIITILTIVGSILGLISSVWTFISAKKSYETMKTTMDSGKLDDAPGWAKGMMTPEMLEMSRKAMENRMPLLIVGLIGSALCLYGALEMRKLKKQGYLLWLIGEIIPLIGTMLFLGAASLSGFGLIGIVFPIIFIILYTVYRKELIY